MNGLDETNSSFHLMDIRNFMLSDIIHMYDDN